MFPRHPRLGAGQYAGAGAPVEARVPCGVSIITTSYGGKLLRAPGPRFTTIVASPLRAVADPRDECYIVTTTTTSKHFASSFWIKPF